MLLNAHVRCTCTCTCMYNDTCTCIYMYIVHAFQFKRGIWVKLMDVHVDTCV